VTTAEATALPDLRPTKDQELWPLKTADEWRAMFADLDALQARLTKVRVLAEPAAFGNPTNEALKSHHDALADVFPLNNADDVIGDIVDAVGDLVNARGMKTIYSEREDAREAERQARRDAYTGWKPKVGDKVWQPDSRRPEIYTVVEIVEVAGEAPVRATGAYGVVRHFDYYQVTAVTEAMLADYYRTVAVIPDYVPKVGDRVKVCCEAMGIWWETGTVEETKPTAKRPNAFVRFPIAGLLSFDFDELTPAR